MRAISKSAYRIRNSKGEYSSGGVEPKFHPSKGKTWHTMGHVKCHLIGVMTQQYYRRKTKIQRDPSTIPEDWVVEEFELVPEALGERSARSLIADGE